MATWTQATAIPQGQLITAAWMTNAVNDVNFLGASGSSSKDLFFAIQQATQTLSTSLTTVISFGASSEVVDKANGHDTTTNNSRYTIQAAGYYRVQAKIGLAISSGTPSYVYAMVFKTSGGTTTTVPGSAIYTGVSTSRVVTTSLPATIVQCAVGDYLQLHARTDAGSIDTVGAGADATTFLVEWVGAS